MRPKAIATNKRTRPFEPEIEHVAKGAGLMPRSRAGSGRGLAQRTWGRTILVGARIDLAVARVFLYLFERAKVLFLCASGQPMLSHQIIKSTSSSGLEYLFLLPACGSCLGY